MDEQSRKKTPVIIELDELELADVVGGAAAGAMPDLLPGRCPLHRPVNAAEVIEA